VREVDSAVRLSRHRQNCAGLLLLWSLCVPLLVGCGVSTSQEQQSLAQKAKGRLADCNAIGDKLFKVQGSRFVVWSLEDNSLHEVHSRLNRSIRYSSGEGPITVFLVSGTRSQYVGSYTLELGLGGTLSNAYLQSLDVCVVQFSDIDDAGTALATHAVVGECPPFEFLLSPDEDRVDRYGPITPKLAEWIRPLARGIWLSGLPKPNCSPRQRLTGPSNPIPVGPQPFSPGR